MRQISLLRIEIENFRCFAKKTVEFGKRCFVRGKNGIGKSTLYNAVLWALFDKDMTGASATDIRPHDANGNNIDFIDISVAATFLVDGREITLKKIQKQNWVKDRDTQKQVFKGNDNFFEVNGIPKKLKDYKEYVSEAFCPEDVFLACSNAQSFFKKDTKKRRAELIKLAGQITDADVIATNEEFSVLSGDLTDGTVEELITRSKSTIKLHNENLKTIPARIDEQEKSRVDVDLADLELAKNALTENIANIEAKEADLAKQYKEYETAADDVLQLKFRLSDMERGANADLMQRRFSIGKNISDLKTESERIKSNISSAETIVSYKKKKIASFEEDIKKASAEWKEMNKAVIDEKALFCKYCGQEYPADKKESIVLDFEKNKAKNLKDITDKGNELRKKIDEETALATESENALNNDKAMLVKIDEQLAECEKQLSELTERVDFSQNKEYAKVLSEIKEKEEFVAKGQFASDARADLIAEKAERQLLLRDVEYKIASAQRNNDIDDRIEELRAEQREISQKIADEERKLDLLERFNRAKMEMLTESVNKHFKIVKWKLFEEQINGSYADVCFATMNGTNYERGLNDSDCLLANLDILQTFQRMNDVCLPLWLDRAESVNVKRIPQTEGQLICLSVSEDEEMVVE